MTVDRLSHSRRNPGILDSSPDFFDVKQRHEPCFGERALPGLYRIKVRHTGRTSMRCGRCGANMFKTELYLSEALVKLKTVLAWRCDKCGRVEYYSSQPRQANATL